MKKIYAIFHINLNFSLIEPREYVQVISQCYWPLLKIAEKEDIKIGLEMSGNTLLKIQQYDELFIEKLKDLLRKKKVEIVASGFEQVISPLVPQEVTIENLKLGQKYYKEILSVNPKVAYINEQTFSDGVIGLYKNSGYEAIVIDWDNLPEEIKKKYSPYQPTILKNQLGQEIKGLFISFVAMQQFRRVIFGQLSDSQYLKYLAEITKNSAITYFPIYGDDVEIYDFKPGALNFNIHSAPSSNLQKMTQVLKKLKKGFDFILPGDLLKLDFGSQKIQITDSNMTIRTKKQDKYNATRWAVCGRTNSKTNTICFNIFKNIAVLEGFKKMYKNNSDLYGKINYLKESLVHLFASDFRTHTTESKWLLFQKELLGLIRESEELIAQGVNNRSLAENSFRLINPTSRNWVNHVYEKMILFKPGRIYGSIGILLKPENSQEHSQIPSQQEEVTYYEDGSIQSARVVFRVTLSAYSELNGMLRSEKVITPHHMIKISKYKTQSLLIKFLNQKGGTIESLTFPSLFKKGLCGSVLQGYYSTPKLSVDWFSGHTTIQLKDGSTLTDLEKTQLYAPNDIENYPIRIPVYGKMKIGHGELVKRYYLYTNEPRVDIEKDFMFYNLEPKAFRNFNLTLLPDSFNLDSLSLNTVNGGGGEEKFQLEGSQINQDEPVNLKVSSYGCQGAVEGWVAIGDKDKSLGIISNLAENYSVPLVHFKQLDNTFFGRISTTIAESDETAAHFFRGKLHFKTALYGAKSADEIRKESYFINNPLLMALSIA